MRSLTRGIRWCAEACFLWTVLPVYAADRSVKVCARDERDGTIANAVVASGGQRAITDASGCAVITVAGSQSMVEVSGDGFATVTQAAGSVDELDVVLRLASVSSTVEVT